MGQWARQALQHNDGYDSGRSDIAAELKEKDKKAEKKKAKKSKGHDKKAKDSKLKEKDQAKSKGEAKPKAGSMASTLTGSARPKGGGSLGRYIECIAMAIVCLLPFFVPSISVKEEMCQGIWPNWGGRLGSHGSKLPRHCC